MNRNVRFLLIALATVAAFIAPVAIYAIFGLPEHDSSLNRLREQVVQMTSNVAFLHAAQRHRDRVPTSLAAMESALVQARAALPEQPSLQGLRQDLDTIAARCACTVVKFEQRKSFTFGAVRILPVMIEIDGDREALPGIVRDLEKSPALTSVEAVKLRPLDDKREQMLMRVDRYGVIERYGIIIVR